MRPINLIPEELRARSGPTENPVPAYAVVGTLAAFVLMMLGLVFYSNKITTLEDQTKAAQAESQRYQVNVPKYEPINDFANTVHQRTLLIGALAESRFPWHLAMFNLAKAIPDTVTLDGIDGSSKTDAEAAPAAAGQAPASAATGVQYELSGCAKSHTVVAQMIVRMRAMPGVQKAELKNSSRGSGNSASTAAPAAGADSDERKQNCGKKPVSFTMSVAFEPITVDLTGLPRPEAAPAAPAAGAAPAPGAAPAATPAASPTAAPAG